VAHSTEQMTFFSNNSMALTKQSVMEWNASHNFMKAKLGQKNINFVSLIESDSNQFLLGNFEIENSSVL
jgi:hypothetical protein